ncbi:hypothetical protein K432DRAFT_35273 [Lepidopterella palustris CBS 459.81]|uniref:Uncharacterized protein n=1 Tax=Lepidopterella palustris CBS 459.81 TaxID=1314670 RepID=A0A8E2JG86_9PEZI|nr:hypothetical protein K432DRAFT_35273 [Lepidopterella palustris CBS 459.81]
MQIPRIAYLRQNETAACMDYITCRLLDGVRYFTIGLISRWKRNASRTFFFGFRDNSGLIFLTRLFRVLGELGAEVNLLVIDALISGAQHGWEQCGDTLRRTSAQRFKEFFFFGEPNVMIAAIRAISPAVHGLLKCCGEGSMNAGLAVVLRGLYSARRHGAS